MAAKVNSKKRDELEKTVDPGQTPATNLPAQKSVAASSFSNWSRGISPGELKKPDVARAIAKMLLTENDTLHREIESLRPFESRYYEADKRTEILSERIRGVRKNVDRRVLLSSAGFGLLGFSPFFWSQHLSLFIGSLVVGVVLIALGHFTSEISDKFDQ